MRPRLSGRHVRSSTVGFPGTERFASLIGRSNHKNAVDSPLLRLPAEIRNSIFELVLGGHSIDMSIQGSSRKTIIKKLKIPKDTDEATPNPQSDFANAPCICHMIDPATRLSLIRKLQESKRAAVENPSNPESHLAQIPSVCRQIYVETRLSLIALSEFSLPTTKILAGFTYEQRRHIRTVRVSVLMGRIESLQSRDFDDCLQEHRPVLEACLELKQIIVLYRIGHERATMRQDLAVLLEQKVRCYFPGVEVRFVQRD